MSKHVVPNAVRSIAVVSKVLMGTVLFSAFTGQNLYAQVGSDCLACHSALPATLENLIPEEPVSTPVVSNACVYSAAELFDGWGWNPITRQSCPPLTGPSPVIASNCDYSNADSFDGWGWDPVARESCAPLTDDDPHTIFPVCSATLYDADGDGFGWENQASCIITSASAPPPVFVNNETGNKVNLTRASWNANNDIANKTIQCDLHYYDSFYREYLLEPVPFRAGANLNNQVFPSYRFYHRSLPTVAPFLGLIESVEYVDGSSITPTTFGTSATWTTDDGR